MMLVSLAYPHPLHLPQGAGAHELAAPDTRTKP